VIGGLLGAGGSRPQARLAVSDGSPSHERTISQRHRHRREHNNYGALGPETDDGDRAYGRYQVMGANIPEWTQKYLGPLDVPDEFLKDKRRRTQVFDAHTSNAYKKYGNLDDVTSTWFSGRPMAQAGNSSDGYNTVPQYVSKVNKAMGGPVDAINAAAGIKPKAAPGAMTSAFAKPDDEEERSQAPKACRAPAKTGMGLASIKGPQGTKVITFQAFTPKADEDPYTKKYKEEDAKGMVELGTKLSDAATDATNQSTTVSEIRKALSNKDVYQGQGGPYVQTLRKAYSAMGFGDSKDVGDGDVANGSEQQARAAAREQRRHQASSGLVLGQRP
jgi:hypothetical protein